MTLLNTLIAALVALPVAGLAALAWLTMAQVEADLLAFNGFEAMSFEL